MSHTHQGRFQRPPLKSIIGGVLGLAIILGPVLLPFSKEAGWQAFGPLVGIMLIVFSLFGELPTWISWTQQFGAWLFPGIAIGTILLLLPLLIPAPNAESSFFAFSPLVWAAYFSIVM